MKTSNFKVMGLLGLPLLAIAVAVMVFAFNPATDNAEAETFKDNGQMSLSVCLDLPKADGTKDNRGLVCQNEAVAVDGKVKVPEKSNFHVIVNADAIPPSGYILASSWVNYGATGLVSKNDRTVLWPDGSLDTTVQGTATNAENIGALTGVIGPEPSFHKGPLFSYELTCNNAVDEVTQSPHLIQLYTANHPDAGTDGALFTDGNNQQQVPNEIAAGVADAITVSCAAATPTPTSPPTDTPPAIPRMSKCDQTDNDADGIKDNGACSPLVNVFLTRQGSKVPSDTCLSGNNGANLAEKLSGEIDTIDPKGDPQGLAAFEFELHYDNTKVCVEITAGQGFVDAGGICVFEDSVTKPQLEGVARAGCVTVKKGHDINELLPMANITVRPQPDVYSQAKPNQSNGVVVQLNNVGCDVSDEQGHAVPLFSCDDADITFRYLEGDVEPDCVIDAVDAQAIAFRWGATKGGLIYRDFMNLEPSGTQSDNDIDINDLQFVFGRFNSTCKDPHPAYQAIPANPKA